MKVTRVCPITNEPVEAIILGEPDMITGLVVICNILTEEEKCPLGRTHRCMFYLNPEKKHHVGFY